MKMPQFKRKVAFSSKKKKDQLQARRNKKRVDEIVEKTSEFGPQENLANDVDINWDSLNSEILSSSSLLPDKLAIYQQEVEYTAGPTTSSGRNRYQLKFKKASKHEKSKRQTTHHKPMECLSGIDSETMSELFYPSGLDYPKRPKWNPCMSKKELDQSETRHFRLFCEDIDGNFMDSELSRYELNLETWRQLWRVTEMSDILLIIVDARYPALQFPPYLYNDLVEKKKKDVILILNKCDLVPPSLVLAWKRYFIQQFPKIKVVPFYSLEGCKSTRGLLRMACQSSLRLVDTCRQLVGSEVDLSSWTSKIQDENELSSPSEPIPVNIELAEESIKTYKRFEDGVLTLGTIGHPNVGKSSLINALMGKKVVSVSKTPGHTKHFQTIFLTKSVRLCDCPGLVFPSVCPVELQVVSGSYPIAQFQDPLGVVHYIGTQINLPQKLNLKLNNDLYASTNNNKWTSFTLAESWALKRSYFMKSKGGKPDAYRAANELLRFALSGNKNLIVMLKPPEYHINKEQLEDDPELEEIIVNKVENSAIAEENYKSDDESSNDDDDGGSCEEIIDVSQNKFALLDSDDT